MGIAWIESRGCVTRGFFVACALCQLYEHCEERGRNRKSRLAAGQKQPVVCHGIGLPVAFLLVTGVKEMKMFDTVSVFLSVLDHFTRKHNNRDVQLRFD